MFAGTLESGADGAVFDDGKGWTVPVKGVETAPVGQAVLLGLRPEHIALGAPGSGEAASVEAVEPTGPEDNVVLTLRGQRAIARFPTGSVEAGTTVAVSLDTSKALLFAADTGLRLN